MSHNSTVTYQSQVHLNELSTQDISLLQIQHSGHIMEAFYVRLLSPKTGLKFWTYLGPGHTHGKITWWFTADFHTHTWVDYYLHPWQWFPSADVQSCPLVSVYSIIWGLTSLAFLNLMCCCLVVWLIITSVTVYNASCGVCSGMVL